MSHPAITTLGALKSQGYRPVPVKVEMRNNLIRKLKAGDRLFPGVKGYDDTVIPQLVNAILGKQDIILLGERGQAKSRIVRSLTSLLDEWIPTIAGTEIPEEPLRPITRLGRDLVKEHGDATEIAWIHRDERYGEKLATPDITIADLIGEVDPIKIAEGRYLADEMTLHFGLVPRLNRGIFAINELPDLAERIQVGLLNLLEERDIQIRGHKIRLPLDVFIIATANPEDYTNRGRIITPLKDRFGSQIRTHYPLDTDTEVAIMRQEARPLAGSTVHVSVPWYMEDIVATFSQMARASNHVNQRSGVSVRLSVSNYEVLCANAVRRALRRGERDVVPRICDLDAFPASTSGKIEIESVEEGREGAIVENLLRGAVLEVFKRHVPFDLVREVVAAFDEGVVAQTGEDLTAADEARLLDEIPALRAAVSTLTRGDESPAAVASAVEFVLEGLHLSKRLNKDASGARSAYRGR
jgi:magnesium chelatase subunit I